MPDLDPAISYNAVYLQSVFATVQMFAKYDNTLAFFSGNEVINDDKTSEVAPWVKATTRDIRNFLKTRKLRQVPVGYSAVRHVLTVCYSNVDRLLTAARLISIPTVWRLPNT